MNRDLQIRILHEDVAFYKKNCKIAEGGSQKLFHEKENLLEVNQQLEDKLLEKEQNIGFGTGVSLIERHDLKEKISFLESIVSEKDRLYALLKTTHINRDQELERMKAHNNELCKQVASKDSKIANSERQVDSKHLETIRSENFVTDLEEKLILEKQKWTKLEDRNKSVISENKFLLNDIKEKNLTIATISEQITRIEKNLADAERSNSNLAAKNKNLAKDVCLKKKLLDESKEQNKILLIASSGLKEVIEGLKQGRKDYESQLNGNMFRVENALRFAEEKILRLEAGSCRFDAVPALACTPTKLRDKVVSLVTDKKDFKTPEKFGRWGDHVTSGKTPATSKKTNNGGSTLKKKRRSEEIEEENDF
jgi:chromosome segregation ATPase